MSINVLQRDFIFQLKRQSPFFLDFVKFRHNSFLLSLSPCIAAYPSLSPLAYPSLSIRLLSSLSFSMFHCFLYNFDIYPHCIVSSLPISLSLFLFLFVLIPAFMHSAEQRGKTIVSAISVSLILIVFGIIYCIYPSLTYILFIVWVFCVLFLFIICFCYVCL